MYLINHYYTLIVPSFCLCVGDLFCTKFSFSEKANFKLLYSLQPTEHRHFCQFFDLLTF